MFKRLFYFVLVLVFVSSISVCVFSQEKEMELTVLNYLDITSPEAAAWDAIVEAFNAKYPNITLKIENSSGEAYHQKLAALAAAGDLPDVMYLYPGGRSAEIYKNELTEDLYPFLGADKDKFVPATVAPQWDGKLYELPYGITASHVMYVNTKLLSDLGLTMPKTYDELVAMVPKIKEAGLYPVLMANKDAWVMQSCLFSALVGRIAGQDWLMRAIVPLLSEEEQENIELTVFPDIAGQKGESGSTSTVADCGFGMKAGLTDNKADAAWKWIYFFAGPQASEIRLIQQGMLPSYIMDLSSYDISPLAVKRGAFYPEHSGTAVLDNVISGEPINILNIGLQELALGNTTPEKLAADIEAAMKLVR